MSTSSRSIPRAIGVAIVIAAFSVAGWMFLIKAPAATADNLYDIAERIAKDIDKVIHMRPLVTSAGITIIESRKSIAELSTVERDFEHTYYWKHTWLGSTKRLELKGRFVAKAGFDLSRADLVAPFSIDISADGNTIRATLPPAQINSLEQIKYEIVKDANGLWNKLNAKERQDALNALLADARKSLDKTDILLEAEMSMMTQIEAAIRKSQPSVEIVRRPLP